MAAWIISILAHVAILLIAARIMVDLFSTPPPSEPFAVKFRKPIDIADEPVEVPGLGPREESGVETPEDRERMERDRPVDREPEMGDKRPFELRKMIGPGREGDEGTSLFGMRTEAGIENALQKGGGTRGTQDAVMLALRWLSRHQDEDGKWSPSKFMARDANNDRCRGGGSPVNVIGVSSLSLLCFLGSGYHHAEGKYSGVVRRGLEYLRSVQEDGGAFVRSANAPPNMYDQALATLVMIEAAALTGDAECYRRAQQGVSVIVRAQQGLGGWDYTPAPTNRNDMSVTGWQLLTLKAAEAVDIQVTWRVKRNAIRFIDIASRSRKLARYMYHEDKPAEQASMVSHPLTAAALLGRIVMGQARRGEIDRITSTIASAPPDWEAMVRKGGPMRGAQNFYSWYYGTMAVFQMGNGAWETWNQAMRPALVANQRKRGCAAGSWDPATALAKTQGGRVYATAMCCLCLEVYYRYLQVYERADQPSYGDVILAEYREETAPAKKLELLNSLAEYATASVKRGLSGILGRVGEADTLRMRAAELMMRMGEAPSVRAMLAFLETGDTGIRARAIRMVTRIAGPGLDPGEIEALLVSDEVIVRATAVRILEKIGGRKVVDLLIERLADTDRSIAHSAVVALRAMTGMTLNFDADAPGDEKAEAIEQWRQWWEREKDAPDFGRARLIRARITDINGATGEVTFDAGGRNGVSVGQVFVVEKDIRGEAIVVELEIVDAGHTTSRARIPERSQAFSLATGDLAVFDASRGDDTP